jgi:hypothetical protein
VENGDIMRTIFRNAINNIMITTIITTARDILSNIIMENKSSAYRENDFARWQYDDYFIPYLRTYLFYDKISAYYHEFGDNIMILEANKQPSFRGCP